MLMIFWEYVFYVHLRQPQLVMIRIIFHGEAHQTLPFDCYCCCRCASPQIMLTFMKWICFASVARVDALKLRKDAWTFRWTMIEGKQFRERVWVEREMKWISRNWCDNADRQHNEARRGFAGNRSSSIHKNHLHHYNSWQRTKPDNGEATNG